jgi:mannose-1-phosphate guanylyltransferase/mannose-6-phosphate isomerase
MSLHPVILAGGHGTRLWPVSTPQQPKPFHSFAWGQTLLQQTALRALRLTGQSPLLTCQAPHQVLATEQLQQVGITVQDTLLETEPLNTGPVVLRAAAWLLAQDPEAVLWVLPADHHILDEAALRAALHTACQLAQSGHLVTFGIQPTEAATGYGYIQPAHPLPLGGYAIDRFIEKPDANTAQRFLEAGNVWWNSGMFCLRARDVLEEAETLAPAMHAWATTGQGPTPAPEPFDRAIMEKTQRGAVIPVAMGWSDVGTWQALWALSPKTEDGNLCAGPVTTAGVRNSLLLADSARLSVLDLEDVLVVQSGKQVLVSHRHSPPEKLKAFALAAAAEGTAPHGGAGEQRPWGFYNVLGKGENFQLKRLVVNPHGVLSLQRHQHRAEHWYVLSGTATVQVGEVTATLSAGQSVDIPLGALHRLSNLSDTEPLEVIEVQTGQLLSEDDIIRYEDIYQRDGVLAHV